MGKKQEKDTRPVIDEKGKSAMGILAGQTARQATIDACTRAGLTVEKVAKTVVNALNAKVVRAQLDPRGNWAMSEPLVDHPTRLKAVESSIVLLDLKPTEKKQIDVISTMSDDEIDRKLAALLGKK
jgi:hypothetical protein